ncbi:MAG: hypothetical protein FJ100_04040 [Deltaproteobacteria bacterium]|nr:hypothetical protein [Deltaproteobacteria bacterium]
MNRPAAPTGAEAPHALPVAGPMPARGSAVAPVVATNPVQGGAWRRFEVARLPWGSGPGQAGRVAEGDQNLEGPMAIDVSADGSVWLLDQVNRRILVFADGQAPRAIAAPRTAQDLVVDGAGQPWTLDRLVDRQVRQLDAQTGQVAQTLDLAAAGVAEPGLSTALWLHQGHLWLELENTHLVPLQSKSAAIKGRPSRDGHWLLSALRVPPDKVAVAGVQVGQTESGAPGVALQHQFDLPVWAIADLDSDAGGRVWLTADLVRFGPDDRPADRKRMAIAWTPQGKVAAQVALCAPEGAEEQFRTVRITTAGEIVNLCRGPLGIVVERWAP